MEVLASGQQGTVSGGLCLRHQWSGKKKQKRRKHGRQNITKSRVDCFVWVLAYKLFGIVSKEFRMNKQNRIVEKRFQIGSSMFQMWRARIKSIRNSQWPFQVCYFSVILRALGESSPDFDLLSNVSSHAVFIKQCHHWLIPH